MVVDTQILGLVAQDARIRLKDLAKKTKKSLQRVKYTFSVYEREYLEHPHAVIDYSRLGLLLFRVYFSGAYFAEQDKEKILAAFIKTPDVIAVYELEGAYDLVIEVVSENPSKFSKLFKQLIARFPTLHNYLIVLNTVTYLYPREYLLKDTHNSILIGGDRPVEKLSENEKIILNLISQKPRIPMRTLAKTVGMHTKTVQSVIKTLSEKKILRGFQYTLQTAALNISKFRLFLTFHSAEREDNIMKYLESVPEVVALNKTLTFWECDIESFDKRKIRKIILTLRENFKDVLQTSTSAEFYQYYKRQYNFLE